MSLLAHLWGLGHRPLAHDEAIDAWFSWRVGQGNLVKYDPAFHGPLRFYLEGGILHALGNSPFWARFLAAMCGVAMTAIIALRVRLLGRVGAPAAALVFTFSPTVLTITRTGREDALVALLSLALILLVCDIMQRPRTWQFVLCGALLATMWATKETVFLFGAVAAAYFATALLVAWRRPEGHIRRSMRRIGALGSGPWWLAAGAFLGVFTVTFSAFFRHADGVRAGFVDGIRYSWSQHSVNRGSQDWHYYLTVYTAYEWLLLPLAIMGAMVLARRRAVWGAWLTTMWIGQTMVYSWAGERFAWLAVHPLVPATLLAGVGAEAAWRRVQGRIAVRRWVLVAAGALLALNAVVAWRPAVTNGADPRELLVTVQTTDDVPPIARLLNQAVADGTVTSILIDRRGEHGKGGIKSADVDVVADGVAVRIVAAGVRMAVG